MHKIVLTKDICSKIDSLIPSIDEFIDKYNSGLWPVNQRTEDEKQEEGDLYIAGVWRKDAFDDILGKLEAVRNEIEDEFRKVYGT